MTNVVPLRLAPAAPLTAEAAFHLARRDMLHAFRRWAETLPAEADVQLEIEGTKGAMVCLDRLERGDGA